MQGNGADYALTGTITPIVKPIFGTAFTVNLDAGWLIVGSADKSVVMRKPGKSTYKARMDAAMICVTRLGLAIEGAARENIRQGLQAIAELGL